MLLGTQKVNAKGHLEIGGCDTVELAKQFGTPLYVLDETTIRQKCEEYRTAFESRYSNVDFYFAGKALLNTAVCKIIEQESFGLDVASAGELYTAVAAGFPTNKIALHGNNKSIDELNMAVSNRIGSVVIDNLLEIEMLNEIANKQGAKQKVFLRVAPSVDPKTHKFIRTGQADTKFGMNIKSGSAMEGVEKILASPGLQLVGYHCHVGSQLLDFESHIAGAKALVKFAAEVREKTRFEPDSINIGGGIGIRYLENQQPVELDDYAEHLINAYKRALSKYLFHDVRLLQEPGRSLVGEAGITLYTIGNIKKVILSEPAGEKYYVSIDGGMSDNPRPALYGAVYTPVVANKMDSAANLEVTISGKHCETDTLIPSARIASPEPGDILAVLSTGAYNYSMASNYNRFQKPAMVLVSDGEADLIVRRESVEEITRNDIIPSRLK